MLWRDAAEKKGIGDMVVPVYISLDPARDTIGQLRHYAKGSAYR